MKPAPLGKRIRQSSRLPTPGLITSLIVNDTSQYVRVYDRRKMILVRSDVLASLEGVSISSVQVFTTANLIARVESAVSYCVHSTTAMGQAEKIVRVGSLSSGKLLSPSFISVADKDLRQKWRHYTQADLDNWVEFCKFLYENNLESETLAMLAVMQEVASSTLLYHLWLNRKR